MLTNYFEKWKGVLDMKKDKEVSIILGRPFLAIGRTIIDV